jgi:Calx-beta domain/FG-GAP-like repeat
MWFRSLIDSLARPRRHRAASPKQTARLLLMEGLEDRCLMAFSPISSYPVGPNPQAVVSGDFNSDGKLDLAVGNHDDRTVGVLLGDGLGGFGAARQSIVGTAGPVSLAVADFNNDGKLDLAVLTQDPVGDVSNSTVSVVLGNGDGTFGAPTPWGGAIEMAAGDFNADGNIDLVVGCYDFDSGGYVQVLLGNGRGGSTAARAEWSPISFIGPAGMAVGDLNGDDKLDAVGTSGTIVVPFFGNGDGTFPLNNFEPELVTGPDPQAVAIGDFTGDGIPDLITVGQTVDLFLGHGDFDDAISQTSNGAMHTGVAVADFNGDGKLDAVTSDADTGTVSLMLGNGAGALAYSGAFAVGSTPSAVAVGDFNGDGRPDAAVANGGSNSVSVLLNDSGAPLPPSLRVSDVTVKEGNAGTVAATFTVTLSAANAQTITVAYATASGTATAGSDYNSASDTLTFAPGETSKTIRVLVNGDRLGEAIETFFVNLNGATNATIADALGVGTIVDDEPRISISDVSKAEGKKNQTTLFTFTVTLSAAYDQAVTMSFRTVDGTAKTSDSDYVAKTGTLTFAPGETTKTITIEVKGDSKKEANETFYMDLFGNGSNSIFTKSRGLGTILDDDGGALLLTLATDLATASEHPGHRR